MQAQSHSSSMASSCPAMSPSIICLSKEISVHLNEINVLLTHSVGLKWACALVLIAGMLFSDVPSQLGLLSQVCTVHRPFESCLHHVGHETLLPGYGFHYNVKLRWLVVIIKTKKYHACPFLNIHWNGNQYCILVPQFG